MNNKTKRLFALILSLLTVLTVFAGCKKDAPENLTITLEVGQTVRLSADALYEALGEDANIVWMTSDEKVASVDETGLVTYVGYGKATITADATSANGKKTKKAYYSISCLIDTTVTGIKFDKYYANLANDGDAATFVATTVQSGDRIVSWKSANEAVATVKDGVVTRIGAGRTEIIATSAFGYKESCYVMCDSVVMSMGDLEITDSMYCYWMASYKTKLVEQTAEYYAYMQQSGYDVSFDYDNASFWSQDWEADDGNTTYAEALEETVYLSVKQILEAVYAYKEENGGKIPEEVTSKVDEQIETLMKTENMENILAHFYADKEVVRKIFTFEQMTSDFYDELFSEGGRLEVLDADIKAEYLKEYVSIKHIFFDTQYSIDEDGNITEITEDDRKEKTELAEQVYAKLQSGELSFDEAIEQYSEDDEEYKSGYTFTEGTFVDEIYFETLKLTEGQIGKLTTDYGIHIIMRTAVDASKIDDQTSSDIADKLMNERFDDLISVNEGLIKENKDIQSSYKAEEFPLFSDFFD